jgi:predicted PurR-regulated permease PerM
MIIAVLAFGALQGLPGMFISIPLIVMVNVIFDQFDSLKPGGFPLGDTMPEMAIF